VWRCAIPSCPPSHCAAFLCTVHLANPNQPDLAKLLAARAGSSSSSKHVVHSAGIKSHVKVPRLNGGKMGVLATRTPHRPVPIGLSTVQVRAAEQDKAFLLNSALGGGSSITVALNVTCT
jgi:hypothetical protein